MNKLQPLRAIRKMCLSCREGCKEVKECPFEKAQGNMPNGCPLFPFRTGKGVNRGSKMRAMRRYCLWCSGLDK